MVKVDIVSGFLGAGKTTLIKKLINEVYRGKKVVLIENEYGEIGIDGGFLQEAGIQIREMNSGCICCSLVGDFDKALVEVVKTYEPENIIIEPSGVGALSDIVAAVMGTSDRIDVEINSLTTVVDVKKSKLYSKNFGAFFNDQIKSADAVVLSRTDVADEDTIKDAVELIRSLNDKATLITTPIAEVEGDVLYDAIAGTETLKDKVLKEMEEEEHHHHHHHHDDDEHEHHGCCHHDHDDDDDDEHEHHGCCRHDHDDDDDDEHEHRGCCLHDHDDEDDDEHEHHHHHHHHHHHGEHDAEDVFESWGHETIKKFTEEELSGILNELTKEEDYGIVLRAKGMVETPDKEWVDFDMVPGEIEIRDGRPQTTGKICVIGSELKEDAIEGLFGV